MRSNEHWNAVHKSAARLKYLLHIPLRRHLRSDWEIGNDHIRSRLFQNADDVIGRARRFLDDTFQIFADAIVRHTAMHPHAERRHLGESEGIIGCTENCFAEIAPHLRYIYIEGGAEFDVTHVITAELDVHQTRHVFLFAGAFVEFYALHKRRGAIPHSNNSHTNHDGTPSSLGVRSP